MWLMGELLMLDLLRDKREDYYFWEGIVRRRERRRWDCLRLCCRRNEDSLRRKVLAVERRTF